MWDTVVVDLPADTLNKRFTLLSQRFNTVRKQSEVLVEPLSEADAQLQSMGDASPAKWHLAHTTWFFETIILCSACSDYQRYDEAYNYLFNSYYNGIGEQYPRHQRGLISRPSLTQVLSYRQYVTESVLRFIDTRPEKKWLDLIELGIHHEQQHQELLLTDIKHAFFQNPCYPAYSKAPTEPATSVRPLSWLSIDAGLHTIGYEQEGFCFDNEQPAHQVYLYPFLLASRLVSNGEYLAFVEDGGYHQPEYWFADAWAWLQQCRAQNIYGMNSGEHPLYWLQREGEWFEFTLHGLQALSMAQPLIHISYYEACAYAAWANARLPTEFEWEAAFKQQQLQPPQQGISVHPMVSGSQEFDDAYTCAWQWTSSHYGPYPGFATFEGHAGEYNGKFMSNQYVLRGSSCVTPTGHSRVSYRNFFYPTQSWQFSGIRLAQSL